MSNFDEAMGRLRDLVTGHPLQATLMGDRDSWIRLCDGMDALQDADASSPEGMSTQRNAMDSIRAELAIPATDWAGVDKTDESAHRAALQASLEAVATEMGDRVNAHFEEFDGIQLADHLERMDYTVAKIAEGAQRLLEGGSDIEWGRVALETVHGVLKDVRHQLVKRGFADHLFDVDDALFVTGVIQDGFDSPGSLDRRRELALHSRFVLPNLIDRLRELLVDIDRTYKEREAGWSPTP